MLPGQIKNPPLLETPATRQPVSSEQPAKTTAANATGITGRHQYLSIPSVTRPALLQLYQARVSPGLALLIVSSIPSRGSNLAA